MKKVLVVCLTMLLSLGMMAQETQAKKKAVKKVEKAEKQKLK